MEARTRYACLALSVLLVVGGTLATGVVPGTLPAQAVAGGVIVAGFGLVYVCLRD
ncbi:MAG: hypothetical protein ABEH77_07445 [Halobacteriaceae archaeon]